MIRATRAAALALVVAVLSGCGTLANLGGQGWQNTHIYGGVLRDVKSAEDFIADHPIKMDREIQQNIGTVTGTALVALDVPLSAIGDTLTLPITVPVAIWMNTRGPAVVSQKKSAAPLALPPGDAFMRKLAAELFGTFALVFAGTGAIVVNRASGGAVSHVGISLTFGLIVLALVYALGDVSGAHLNPAVTLGFWLARRFGGLLVLPYVVSQCAGAFAASFLLRLLYPDDPTLGATLPAGPAMQSFVLEVVLTLLLMFVILSVATGAKEKGVMAGVAVGAVIALEALFAGPTCGASMNPARSLAPAVVSGRLEHLWVYLTAPVLGASLAVPLFVGIHGRPAPSA